MKEEEDADRIDNENKVATSSYMYDKFVHVAIATLQKLGLNSCSI